MISDKDKRKLASSVMSAGLLSGRGNDPAFYAGLSVMPNPDYTLRMLGKAQATYDAIMADSHVIGEIRAVRSGLLGFDRQLKPGDDSKEAQQAFELCQMWMRKRPAPGKLWNDVTWNMGEAVFRGMRGHELEWMLMDGYLLPKRVIDVPNRRLVYTADNELRLLTRANPYQGEEVPDKRFLITRHMHDSDNPYGVALLSSCFWPYTFKHGGFRMFYKFCERFGMPWPIGKYPQGTLPEEQQELLDALLTLREDGAAAIPDGDKIELLEVTASGSTLPQKVIIDVCNREMSKALTSQTLATEQTQNGSRAASETALKREGMVTESDRRIIEASYDQMFSWITEFNIGPDVPPPTMRLVKRHKPTSDMASILTQAAKLSDKIPVSEVHDKLGIRQANQGEDTVKLQVDTPSMVTPTVSAFSAPTSKESQTPSSQLDNTLEEDYIEPLYQMLLRYEKDGKTLKTFMDDLPTLFAQLDDDSTQSLISAVFERYFTQGMSDVGR
ncbi:DUF935 family protein [Vibrio sp. YMD68]|uniref:phage portal protein family protein n=1 Tax=Vibrio sp. YMD68 TaxID=3042300 RepID=UPI00249BA209|nr:DUF935 family protein [Vibrio sp. YMD68]WGV98853.1 DUF935 family protein [Vibrio sp. YMD68]WGW01220.1 DUF935 family protein [Vibrio sp. YMD68]